MHRQHGKLPSSRKCLLKCYSLLTTRTTGYDKEQRMGQLDRITQQPDVMGGKACIRGMRVTVGMVVGQVGAGLSVDQILADFPYLEREDVMQALRYAAWRAEEREVTLASA
jgi:uncharacterized protein (DUF433 family)